MSKTLQNDFIIDIFQDIYEIESLTKVLKDSVNSENKTISEMDIENTLEILITKIANVKLSLNKYIEDSYE